MRIRERRGQSPAAIRSFDKRMRMNYIVSEVSEAFMAAAEKELVL